MTETLHWYAETTGGVRQGDAPVHPGCGALHLSADLPAGTLKAVRAELPWKMEADERLFMNGYQTWTYSPELNRNGKLRGTDHIPGFLRKKYAFDRYGDYHFVPYGHHNGQSHGFSYFIISGFSASRVSTRLWLCAMRVVSLIITGVSKRSLISKARRV